MRQIAKDIQEMIDNDFQVQPEFFPNDSNSDHIHIEYQPKYHQEDDILNYNSLPITDKEKRCVQ